MTYIRRLPKFEYLAPRTIADVCGLLASRSDKARLLAGGTDLIMQMRRREAVPRYVIGLKSVPELAFIREQADGTVAVGAMTTIQSLLSSPLIRKKYGIVAQTAAEMGSPEVRQLATLGGNIAGALPCADFPPALMALGATLKLRSQHGERSLAVDEFFLSFERTAKTRDELLTEIQLPSTPARSGGVYLKFHDRHSMDMTTVGVSAFVTSDAKGRILRDIKIALASSAPVPIRAKKAEAALKGEVFAEKALNQAAALVCEEAEPRDSWRASKAFRVELLRTLTKRAIRNAWDRAVSSNGGAA